MSNDWREYHTSLCKYITTEYVFPEDECKCSDDYWSGWDGGVCDCPDNPIMKTTLIDVRIVGEPVRTEPNNSRYVVSIYQDDIDQDDADCNYPFDSSNLLYEFSLMNTQDREKSPYYDIVNKHMRKLENKQVIKKKFNGTCSKESYVKAFEKIVEGLFSFEKMAMDGTERDNENAHISKRQKKKMEKSRKKKKQ